MQLLGRQHREAFGQIEPHLVPEYAERARPRPVHLARAGIEHALHQVEILPHRRDATPRHASRQAASIATVSEVSFAASAASRYGSIAGLHGNAMVPIPYPALAALFAPAAAASLEIAIFAFLDDAGRLLGVRHVGAGSATRLDIPFRAVAIDALAFDATRVVMAHNHPSGATTFSREDLAVTRRLATALDAIGVRLFDHLLLTRDAVVSLRSQGLI